MTAHRTPPETLIADRGGATPGYANDPAKLLLCNAWVDHARPIIKAMFALDDEADAPLLQARLADDTRYAVWSKQSPQVRDYDEARQTIRKAYRELEAMLNGIRDAYIADERPGAQDDDAAQDEADDFSDWLDSSTITVAQAIDIVTDEHNATAWGQAA